MAAPADAIFVDGEIHVRPGEDRTEAALAVRDGTVCRVADTYEVEFLEGVKTRRVDLDGRTVVPGFVDGFADLLSTGQRLGGDEDVVGAPPKNVAEASEYLTTAIDAALEAGVTTVFDAVCRPETARVYHELALADELPIRVRLSYWGADSDERLAPLEAVRRLGLVSGSGNDQLRIDSVGIDASDRSTDAVRDFLAGASETGFRVSAMAEDNSALNSLLSAFEGVDVTQPRIWLDEPVPENQVQRLADLGATVAGRTGPATGESEADVKDVANSQGPQFGRLVAGGVPVAFGSNGDRPTPLRDIEAATKASPDARLGVSEALRAATEVTSGSPDAGSPSGPLTEGAPADFVVLSGSPWETPMDQLDVELTVVDGRIEYESSN